jgi:hypothetical protein
MNTENIIPFHYFYSSYSEYLQNQDRDTYYHFHAKRIDLEELSIEKALFIIAEPGFGKSHLMNQLMVYLTAKKATVAFYHGRGEQNLNPGETADIILFDALDECANPSATLSELIDYKRNGKSMIISSRSHYLQPMENILVNAGFSYVQLLRFRDEQIAEFLSQKLDTEKFDLKDIDQVIARSKTNSTKPSPLSIPRYLAALSGDITQRGLNPDQVGQLSKSELFDLMIYHHLDKENGGHNFKYLSRRVLERISLLMEMHQANEISKEDFVTFLDLADSNINHIFLNAGNLDQFWDRVMKSMGEMLVFENTEFQEYLAAKELLRLGNKFQIIYDLLVDPQLNIVPSNWIDVLSFAIDMEPSIVEPVIAFIENNHFKNIDEQMIKILLECHPDRITPALKRSVFVTVIQYYELTGRYIYDISKSLAGFMDLNDQAELVPRFKIHEITPTRKHIISNQIQLIEVLAETQRLPARVKQMWISYLLRILNEEVMLTLRSTVFFALEGLGAGSKLLSLNHVFAAKQDYIYNDYLNALSRSLPNHPQTLKLVIAVLEKRRRIDQIQSMLGNIDEEKPLITLFRYLTSHKEIVESLSFLSGNEFYSLFSHIEKGTFLKLDKVLAKFMTTLLAERRFSHNMPLFLMKTIEVAVKRIPQTLYVLLKTPYAYNWLENIVNIIIESNDLKLLKSVISCFKTPQAQYDFERFLYRVRQYSGAENGVVKYLSAKYPLSPSRTTPMPQAAAKDPLEELRGYYIDDLKLHNTGLASYFINHHQHLLPLLTEQDKAYIKGIIADVINHYEPDRFNIMIDEQKANSTSFSHNSTIWFQIGVYFKVAVLLEQDELLMANREKVLKSFPRLDADNVDDARLVKELIKVIGGLKSPDIQLMLDFCLNRSDDYLMLNTRDFVKQILQYRLSAFKPLLIKFIESGKLHSFERSEILQTFGELAENQNDRKFLQKCFNNYGPQNHPRLKELANEFLITKFRDVRGIAWRFAELKSRIEEFDSEIRYNGARGVSEFENEMDHGKFGNCFYGIEHERIVEGMLDVLNYSFDIKTNRLHFTYSSYLQQIIAKYFGSVLDNRKLDLLRKTIECFADAELTYSFDVQLYKLYIEYHNRLRERETFTNTILKYNILLKNTYLKIGSSGELRQMLKNIIEKDLLNLIENEGLYRVVRQLNGLEDTEKRVFIPNEDLIQKTLKLALEKTLMENGFRKMDILREVQSYDNLRYDYLINYGLYGPIVVELKLLKNSEIQVKAKRKAYKEKLKKYVRANRDQGIYLVFHTEPDDKHLVAWQELRKEYADIPGLELCMLNTY